MSFTPKMPFRAIFLMKTVNTSFLIAAAALAVLLPTRHIESQTVAPADPLAAIQALQTANDDLIKRQEATLKDLTDMTDTAREVRIFARRG